MNELIVQQLETLKHFFDSGATTGYIFRKKQLLKLKKAILLHQNEIQDALYMDLKKNPEEAWVTETGFLITEISFAISNLKKWMKKKRVATNLMNFPSRSYILNEPMGVVLIIGPWNYPLQLLLVPLVGAMAAGNCAVIKPSEFAPATTAVIKKIILENFEEKYILFVEGNGAEVVPEMMKTFRFNHVFYTGSTHVGRQVYELAARNLVPVTLELGGKSPCIVEKDASLNVSARRIALTKFSNAGQMCIAPDYVLVHESVKNEFVEALKKNIAEFFSASPAMNYNYGKIINEKQFLRLVKYLQNAIIIYGGAFDASSCSIVPTLVEIVDPDTEMMKEEIFGPILPVISFSTFEEAKKIIEKNPDPLALYIFTSSKEVENKWITTIPFGGGCINNASWHFTNLNLPFGGRGFSGTGSYHGKFSYDAFSHRKAIMKTPFWFDPDIKYPPFEGKLNLFKKLIR